MWNFVLYVLAVITGMVLYYFYEENDDKEVTKKESVCLKQPSPNKAFEQRFSVSSLLSSFSSVDDHQDDISTIEKFSTLDDVSAALRSTCVEECCLIFGIDFTASNEWQGKRNFGQGCLHKTSGSKVYNPYQKVIWTLGQTLSSFNEDGRIRAYGFGDFETRNNAVFSLKKSGSCHTFNDVLESYNQICQTVYYGGPTSFVPIINEALDVLSASPNRFHILVIVTDGQLADEEAQIVEETLTAASHHPLSIIAIGVGDGPWEQLQYLEMKNGDQRQFTNFRFVDYHKTTNKVKHPDVALALNALLDVPNQYRQVIELGYINKYIDTTSMISRSSALERSSTSLSSSSKASWLSKLKHKINGPTNKMF